jgi:DNA-binding NarL/FixJ family response regulator
MRILLIAEEVSELELVEKVVSRTPNQVVAVVTAANAVQAAAAGVDVALVMSSGVNALRTLRKEFPQLRLLVISGHEDRLHVLDALVAGADGYVLKSEIEQRLPLALEEVSSGGGSMSAKIAHLVIEELRNAEERRFPEGTASGVTMDPAARSLSAREWDVLQGLSKGLTYQKIAQSLSISVNTVRHHIRNLYDKLEVTGKAAAVTRALTRNEFHRPRG